MCFQVLFGLLDMKKSMASHGDLRLQNILVFLNRSDTPRTSSLYFDSPDGDETFYGISTTASCVPTYVIADFDNSSVGSRDALDVMTYAEKGDWSGLKSRNIAAGFASDAHTLGVVILMAIFDWIDFNVLKFPPNVRNAEKEQGILDMISFCVDILMYDDDDLKDIKVEMEFTDHGRTIWFKRVLVAFKQKIRNAKTLDEKIDAVKCTYYKLDPRSSLAKDVKFWKRRVFEDLAFMPYSPVIKSTEEKTKDFWKHPFFAPLHVSSLPDEGTLKKNARKRRRANA